MKTRDQFTYNFFKKEYTCHRCGASQFHTAANLMMLDKALKGFQKKHENCLPKQEPLRTNA
jgi:hypothetical protein